MLFSILNIENKIKIKKIYKKDIAVYTYVHICIYVFQ